MSKQSELILEERLIAQLQKLGYQYVSISSEAALLSNLKTQLEKHNNFTLSNSEFDKVLNILNKGSVFEKAKTLREKQHIVRDNGDNLYFEFLNVEHWCQNEYQVTNQVTVEGTYKNRYDVTLLINGLPLVQIELKRRGLELKEAFNQINRYQRHSFGANSALFQYLQLFVISNGVNTKYYANNRHQSFKQTFYWTDRENKRSKDLVDLVVLIERGNLDPEAVQQALIETFRRRKRHPLPSNLQPPPASWAREFPSMAAEAGASTLDVNSAFKALDGFWRKHGLGASEPVSR